MDWSLVIGAAVFTLVVWAVRSFVRDELRRAAVARELVEIVARDPRMSARVGTMEHAGTTTGNVHATRDGLRAMLAIEVLTGGRRGILYVNALRTEGRWCFASRTLHLDRQTIELDPAIPLAHTHTHPAQRVPLDARASFPWPGCAACRAA